MVSSTISTDSKVGLCNISLFFIFPNNSIILSPIYTYIIKLYKLFVSISEIYNILDTMKIMIDKDADAMYIEFSDAPFSKNKKMDDTTILDLDNKGNIIGIEILDVSKRISK